MRLALVPTAVFNQKLIGSKGFSLARVLEIPPKERSLTIKSLAAVAPKPIFLR